MRSLCEQTKIERTDSQWPVAVPHEYQRPSLETCGQRERQAEDQFVDRITHAPNRLTEDTASASV